MATAPFTPFYSTPYAYPSSAAAAYPPPASGSFPAPAYGPQGPYSFPSTTTYPPPPYSGGYYTSPFPYAATYSYPPPASACTPAAGFSPAPAYGPSTYRCAAASPCLTSAATPIPTNVEPNWPPPAPDPTPPTPNSTPSCCWSSSMTTPVPPHHPATTGQMLSSAAPSSSSLAYSPPSPTTGAPAYSATPATPQPNAALTSPNRQYHAATPTGFSTSPLFELPHANSPVFTEMESTSAVSSPVLVPGSASLVSLQSQLSKLMDMASSLSNSMAKAASMMSTTATSRKGCKSQRHPSPTASDSKPSKVTSGRASTGRIVAELHAHEVPCMMKNKGSAFLPEPPNSTCHGDGTSSVSTPGISLTPATTGSTPLFSCTQSSASIASKVFGEMPQQYDFHNLNRQSVVLADGTERGYYALRENYPLERVIVPESVFTVYDDKSDGCSNEFVHVFASTPDQQSYEEKQQDSEQLLKCVGKAPETEQKIACPNYSSRLFDFTLEQQQQEDENAPTNVLQLRVPQLSLLVIHGRREVWDPGASLPFISNKTQHHGQALQLARHATTVASSSVTRFSECKCLPVCSQSIFLYWKSQNGMQAYIPWDPGVLVMHPGITRNITRTTRDAEVSTFLLEAMPSLQRGASSLGNFATSALWRPTTHDGDKISWGLKTAPHSQNVLPCISASDTEHICLFVKLSPWTILSAQHFIDSSMKKGSIFSAERTLPWNPWYAILLLHHCLWKLPISGTKRVQWDPGVEVSLHCWLVVLTAWSENDKPLSCTHIQGLAALQTQSVGNTASYVWDPGTMLLQFKSIWLPNGSEFRDGQLTYMVQSPAPNFSELVRPMVTVLSCWLPSFEIKANLQWDPGIAISFCMDSWLEMTAVKTLARLQRTLLNYLQCQLPMSKISCSEDKFLSQQGLQKKYNTKNLLSSQNYLQIWEMDIIFITFLPP